MEVGALCLYRKPERPYRGVAGYRFHLIEKQAAPCTQGLLAPEPPRGLPLRSARETLLGGLFAVYSGY
jgi:hypothetical protein